MKKTIISIVTLLVVLAMPCANAFEFKFRKNTDAPTRAKILKTQKQEIMSLFNSQVKFADKHDYDNLIKLYSKDFANNDGFNREVYFQLIKDTWETYPDITYKVNVKSIDIKPFYVTIEAIETATATVSASSNIEDGIGAYGELYIESRCIYHIQKINGEWKIIAEDVISEKSHLKFGQAKYVPMEFTTPEIAMSGKEYVSSLVVDLPKGMNAIASIGQASIKYPQEKPEDKYRNISERGLLQRLFNANTENLNEYNSATVAVGRVDSDETEMTGAAFLITRVNVIPVNNYVEDIKTVEEQIKEERETLEKRLKGELDGV